MMKFSEKGIDLLCELEGFSAVPYADSGGAMTIGYGHLILPGQRWDEPLTHDEARWILLGDATYAEHCIRQTVTADLRQNEYDALVCFVFNIGTQAFRKSTLVRFLDAGEYEAAGDEFDRWVYDNGVKVSGLMNRRNREQALFRTDIYA